MKKTLAYLVMGVLLGLVVTLLPLMISYPAYISKVVRIGTLSGEEVPGRGNNYATDKEVFRGAGGFLSSLVYAGLISALGLILALGVYLLFKRWMIA